MWPGWRRSKQPFVKTTLRWARRSVVQTADRCARSRSFSSGAATRPSRRSAQWIGRRPDAGHRAAGGAVRDLRGRFEPLPRAEGDAERREDRVARPRDVEHLPRAGPDPAGLAAARDEEHPLLRELHEEGVELQLVTQACPERRDRGIVARGLARHGLQLLPVRRHERRAAVPAVVSPLRVDERGDPLLPRRGEKPAEERGRQRPLRVVGDEEDVRFVDGAKPRREELLFGVRREPRRDLLVDAEQLPPLGDHPPLHGRRPHGVDDDRPAPPGKGRQAAGEPRPLLARPDGAERDRPRAERDQVLDDVPGAAGAAAHRRDVQERHRCLGRHARDVPRPRLVEHQVAHDARS